MSGPAHTPAKTEVYHCKHCGDPFRARVADRKRGWARFCSKSCKAIRQTQRTGIGRGGIPIHERENGAFTMSPAELALGGYGDADWDTPFGDGKY